MHVKTGDSNLDEQYKKSLTYSIFDGAFFALMMGLGEFYFSAFALVLGASTFQMGFFGSVPHFFGAVAQLLSSKITSFIGSRKKTIIILGFIRTIIWIPLLLSFMFGEYRIWFLILFVTLYFIFNYFQFAPWTSWMGDLIDETSRSKYFANRNKIVTTVMIFGIIVGGLILEFVKNNTTYNPLVGFILLFIIAIIASVLSTVFIFLKKDIPFAERPEDKFSLFVFTKKLATNSYGKFTIFNALFHFGVYIAAPFFITYQMNYLHFTYLNLMISLACMFLGKVISFKIWATLTEKYGNASVLIVSVIVISVVPLLWVFFVVYPWHTYLLNILSGIGWAGHELLSFTYLYDSVPQSQRARSTSYSTFFRGVAILCGGLFGTFIFKLFPESTMLFFGIFIFSFIVRIFAVIYFAKNADELKNIEPVPYGKLIFKLFTSIPRESADLALIGIRIAKNKLLFTDLGAKFILKKHKTVKK